MGLNQEDKVCNRERDNSLQYTSRIKSIKSKIYSGKSKYYNGDDGKSTGDNNKRPKKRLTTFSPFDPHGDHATLSTKWRKWQRRFENLMISLREEDPTVKRALLLTYIGNDANDIFDTLADTGTDYDTAIQRLTKHFSPTENKDMAIFDF